MSPERKSLGAITLAHITVDMQTGSLVVLLPVLLKALGLSYASAAAILSANNIVIAITQPLLGYFGDRYSFKWLVWFGCALTGLGMAAVLWLPTYGLIVLAVMLSGLGSATFHPEALSRIRAFSGPKAASATSFFFSGGNIGFAVGPILATVLLERWGNAGVSLMLLATALGLAALAWRWPHIRQDAPRKSSGHSGKQAARWGLVGFLMLLITLRSTVINGLQAFIPLYFDQIKAPKTEAALLVTLITISGAVGTLAGGVLADRFGRRQVMMVGMAGALLMLQVFMHTDGVLRMAVGVLAGISISTAWPIIVVMIQEAMPGNVGLASGLSLGTSYGATGLAVAVLGLLADAQGLLSTLTLVTALPAAILLLTFALPKSDTNRP